MRERRLPEVDVRDPHQGEALQRPVRAHEVLHEVVGGGHQELGGGRVLGQPPALAQHRDAIAHLDRLVDVVGHEEDRLADRGLEPQELVLKTLAVDRVDGAERLVHEHHAGVRGQGARHPHALLLSPRELGRIAPPEGGIDPHQVEELVDARRDPVPIPAHESRDSRDVVGHGPVREQPDLLDHVADLAPQLGRRAVADRRPAHEDFALRDLHHPVDHPHGGRLSGSRRADEDADLTPGDLEVELGQRRGVGSPVALRHAPEGNRRSRGGRGGAVRSLWARWTAHSQSPGDATEPV
jgi:hypothetical protein